jgi:PAS domain S-box-containing protein
MDRSSWRRFLAGSLAVTTPPTDDRDTRRGRRGALVATAVLAPGLLMAHGLWGGEGDVVALAVAAALIVVLAFARVGQLMVDVRALRAADARSRASETALKEAQQLAQLGSWSWGLTSDEMTWSRELYRIFGLPPEEQNASFDMFQRLLHPDDRQRVLELLERARTAGTGFACEHRVVRPDGTVRVLQARGEVHADVADSTRVQEAAQRLAAIVQSSSDAIYSVAADMTVTSWNAAAERLLDRPAPEMLGHPIASVWPPEHFELNRSMFERAFAGEVITDVETMGLHRDGTRVAVTVSWSPIEDRSGAIIGVSVIARDITQRKQLEEQLVRQALHDPLTGLANRALFADRLEHALTRGRGPGITVAILVIDLDGFKDINDSLGHDAGDDLLMIAGMRLQGHARPDDTVARLGGRRVRGAAGGHRRGRGGALGRGAAGRAGDADRAAGPGPHPNRQHRHRHRRRRGRRSAAAQRRHRHVRRQTAGQGPLCALRAGHARHGRRTSRPRCRPQPGGREGPAAPVLRAADESGLGPDLLPGGAGALASPHSRRGVTGRVHPPRGRDRDDPADRALGAPGRPAVRSRPGRNAGRPQRR